MTKRKAAPKREDPWALVLVMGFFLTLVLVAAAAFNLPQPGARYDVMKMATVELSFHVTDDKGLVHQGHGSGVILSPNFILTVAHVGAAASPEDVLFADGSKGHAMLLWADPSRDVAIMVLAVATKLSPARLAHGAVTAGQEIWSTGYPLDLPLSIQHGEVVSDKISRVQIDETTENGAVIYTNITMAPGDSGGPVFNASGEVVGLNDFITQFAGLSGMVATQAILADVHVVTGLN